MERRPSRLSGSEHLETHRDIAQRAIDEAKRLDSALEVMVNLATEADPQTEPGTITQLGKVLSINDWCETGKGEQILLEALKPAKDRLQLRRV